MQEIHEQCRQAQVSFFFKQWGGVRKKRNGRPLDGRTWDDMPVAMIRWKLTLLTYSCPIQAVVVAFDLDERTVSGWHERGGVKVVDLLSKVQCQRSTSFDRIRLDGDNGQSKPEPNQGNEGNG